MRACIIDLTLRAVCREGDIPTPVARQWIGSPRCGARSFAEDQQHLGTSRRYSSTRLWIG
eukprot:12928015-Prorocentrum_lima.AAC.1